MSNILVDYFYGYMSLNEQISITLLWLVPSLVVFLYYRRRMVTPVISQEIKEGVKVDTPYIDGPRLPRGNFIVWSWEILRDSFVKVFYYNSFTVIRLKKEGKADWRQYTLVPLQMQTVNWDNCTYNVYEKAMIPIRGGNVMLVLEGCTEPVSVDYFWRWIKLIEKVEDKVNSENYERWDESTKDIVGEWKADGFEFYSKMNNRNTQKMALAGVPDLQMMYYAVIVILILSGLIYASMQGWISSGMQEQLGSIHKGLVEIYNKVK